MADYTLNLTLEDEVALAARVADWTQSQPETAWTPQLVLQTMVRSDLASLLRTLDQRLQPLTSVARQMRREEYLPMIAALSGVEKRRLQQLLGE